MRIHPGRAALAALALAELGALAGALLCWMFFAGWALLAHGPLPMNAFLGTLMWAGMVGAPLGAVALPLLGFTLLRQTPLSRALGFSLGGALLGVIAAALLVSGPAVLPVPLLVPALGFGGLFAGVAAARVERWRLLPRAVGRLRS